jgi:hypothetical protein
MILLTKVNAIPLTGTEPQIKWGKQIRKKKLEEFKKMGIRELTLGMKPHLTEQALQDIKCDTPEKCGQFAWSVAYIMFEATEGKWWMDHRDEPIWKWIGPSVKEALIRHKAAKTFK